MFHNQHSEIEYCEIFKNTYFKEHLQMAASVNYRISGYLNVLAPAQNVSDNIKICET